MAGLPIFLKKLNFSVDRFPFFMYNITRGALAQLGAHNTGSVGVRGSSPLCSTRKKHLRKQVLFSMISVPVGTDDIADAMISASQMIYASRMKERILL